MNVFEKNQVKIRKTNKIKHQMKTIANSQNYNMAHYVESKLRMIAT